MVGRGVRLPGPAQLAASANRWCVFQKEPSLMWLSKEQVFRTFLAEPIKFFRLSFHVPKRARSGQVPAIPVSDAGESCDNIRPQQSFSLFCGLRLLDIVSREGKYSCRRRWMH